MIQAFLAHLMASAAAVNMPHLDVSRRKVGRQRIAWRCAYHTGGSRKRRAARRFASFQGRRMRRGR